MNLNDSMFKIILVIMVFNLISVSYSFKSALSLLMMLEVFIIGFLILFLISLEKTTLTLFSVSFLMMCLAVLAATMGLCLLSGYSKLEFQGQSSFF